MTHDTPPKRIWLLPHDGEQRCWCVDPDPAGTGDASDSTEYTLTSEVEAMVAAALQGAAHVDWTAGRNVADTAPEYLNDWQRGLVAGQSAFRDAILALIPQPASAALDKLIAEAVAAATPTMQRAARVLHDEAMAAAYLGENVTEDEAAMLQFIDALGGKTKVIKALHALATATKGDQT